MSQSDFEIIDAHIHPFIAPENNTERFSKTSNTANFFAELKRAGISRSCGSVIHKLTKPAFDEIKELNREALEIRKQQPSFIPGIHIHSNYPEESCAEVETLFKEEHIRWIGELVGGWTDDPSYCSPGMFQIFEVAQTLEITVNIHPFAMDEIEQVCNNFPELNVVIAHPCDSAQMLERYEFIRTHANAYLDLSGTGLFRWGMLRKGINTAGKEKFLFGTDFPICNPAMQVQGVLFEHLTDDEYQAVFSGNFKRLTGIS
jgi:predicted TIM-barrel fold metal-dependent hydrolase